MDLASGFREQLGAAIINRDFVAFLCTFSIQLLCNFGSQ